jgi:hypothetical protein
MPSVGHLPAKVGHHGVIRSGGPNSLHPGPVFLRIVPALELSACGRPRTGHRGPPPLFFCVAGRSFAGISCVAERFPRPLPPSSTSAAGPNLSRCRQRSGPPRRLKFRLTLAAARVSILAEMNNLNLVRPSGCAVGELALFTRGHGNALGGLPTGSPSVNPCPWAVLGPPTG